MALEAFVNGKKKKTDKKVGETLRFELELVEASDEKSNEFVYPQLVEKRTAKLTPKEPAADGPEAGSQNLFDEDPHEQEKLAAIARSLEEKYGAGPKRKKRKIDSDLIDRGHGYDVMDSFVDDSELYEDFVPPQVDTALGGFYVNTGQLDFKCRNDLDPEDADFVIKKKKPRIKKNFSHQKILATQKLKKAKQTALHKTPSKSGKKLLAGSGVVKPVGLAKLKQEKKLKKSPKLTITSTPIKSVTSETPYGSTLSVPVGVGDIAIPVFDPASQISQVDTLGAPSTTLDALGQGEEQADKAPPTPKEPPVLPESLLPPEVLAKVKDLEETIRWDQGNGKKLSTKTRSGYDDKLVEIELLCKAVAMKVRNAVFEFLAYKMGVAKGTLTKRIKAVLKKREDDELEEPIQKLKFAVEVSMPGQMAEYEEAKRTESLSSSSDRTAEVEEETKMEDVFDDSASVPSVTSLPPGGASQPGTTQEAAKAKKTFVRKKYKWTDETRRLLCDVVKIKVDSEERVSRITRGNGEDIIMQFLEERVRPLWPKGWMQKSVLYKMSELAHKHFTNPQPKKAILVKKEKPVTVKRESLDNKPTTLPSLATSSTSSPSQPTATPTTTPSTTTSRAAIIRDPKELVDFLLKDDKNTKVKQELIKKLVLTHQTAKLMEGKRNSPTQTTKSHGTSTVSADSAVRLVEPSKSSPKKAPPTAGRSPKGSKLSISPVMLKNSAVSVTPATTVPALSTLKSSSVATCMSPSSSVSTSNLSKMGALSQSSLLKNSTLTQTLQSKTSGGPLANMPHLTLSSLPKQEKKKKSKTQKGPLSLTASKDSAATTKKTLTPKTGSVNASNSPHMLTTTTGQPYLLQLVNSTMGAPLIKLISNAQSTLQSTSPSTAAPTIVTTSDGRVLITSRSQQNKNSVSQTGVGSKVTAVHPSQDVRLGEDVANLAKGSATVNSAIAGSLSRSVVGSSSRQQQLTAMTSVKTTPVIQLPRVSTSTHNSSSTKTPTQVMSTPPPSLTGSISHTVTNKTPVSSNSLQPQQQLLMGTSLSAVHILPQVLTVQQPQTQPLLNMGVRDVVKTVTAVPSPRPAVPSPRTAVPSPKTTAASLTFGIQDAHAQESLQIPPLSTLVPPTLQTAAATPPPLTRPLSVVGAQPATWEAIPPPLTGTQTITETPPLAPAHWLHGQQKEPSPLKSPVEQIMAEHSYLGSQHVQLHLGQTSLPLVFTHTPSSQQTVGEVVPQPHLKNVSYNPKE